MSLPQLPVHIDGATIVAAIILAVWAMASIVAAAWLADRLL